MFKLYNKEQLEKIERLRQDAEAEREAKKNELRQKSSTIRRDFEVGSPVFVTLEGKTISGYVMSRSGDGYFSTYEVKTPLGRIKDVKGSDIRGRYMEDLSGVEIPKELKECPTVKLLNMLQTFRSGSYSYYTGPEFTKDQIKAELRLRPHISTKRERKIFKKYAK